MVKKKKIVKPRKWNEILWDEKQIESELNNSLENAGFNQEDIVLKPRKYISGTLYNQLQLFWFDKTGKRSAEPAIRYFGWNTQRQTSEKDIETVFKKKIDLSLIEKILVNGKSQNFGFKKLLTTNEDGSVDKEGLKVYRTLVGKNRNSNVDHFKIYSDKFFDHVEEKIGESVYNILKGNYMKGDNLVKKIKHYFYDLKLDMSAEGLKNSGIEENIVAQRIRRHKTEHGLDFNSYTDNLCDLLSLERRHSSLLSLDRNGGTREGSLIGELMNYFSLSILKKFDPNLDKLDSYFKKFYSGTIKEVLHNSPKERVRVSNGAIADGRVITSSEDILIEYKNHNVIRRTKKNISGDIIKHYNGSSVWKTGEDISKRLIILNVDNGDVNSQKKVLENNYWKVMSGNEFKDFVLGCVDILLEEDPDFFSTAPIPVYNGVEFMEDITSTLFKQSHLLLNSGQKKYRQWLARFFRENASAVLSDTRVSHQTFEQLNSKRLEEFDSPFNSVPEYDLRNYLFFDLETAGTVNSGSPLFTIGSFYRSNGSYNVDVFLIRNPWEEIKGIDYFRNKIETVRKEHGEVTAVSFNGHTFDVPFFDERQVANRIEPFEFDHLDILPKFRKIQVDNKEKYTLQTYEFNKWGVRRNDIPGKRIPQVWDNYVHGKDSSLVPDVILHNGLDVITTAHLFSELYKDELKLKKVKK